MLSYNILFKVAKTKLLSSLYNYDGDFMAPPEFKLEDDCNVSDIISSALNGMVSDMQSTVKLNGMVFTSTSSKQIIVGDRVYGAYVDRENVNILERCCNVS